MAPGSPEKDGPFPKKDEPFSPRDRGASKKGGGCPVRTDVRAGLLQGAERRPDGGVAWPEELTSTLSDCRPESAAPSGGPHSPNPLSPILPPALTGERGLQSPSLSVFLPLLPSGREAG